jgi:hypothetical protein
MFQKTVDSLGRTPHEIHGDHGRPAGCFFFNGWDSTILSAGVMEYHGHCGKHVEESSCIPATLAVDCKIIKEPWATPDRATPTSCYSFKKKRKKQKNLKKKPYPKIQKKQKIQEYYVE